VLNSSIRLEPGAESEVASRTNPPWAPRQPPRCVNRIHERAPNYLRAWPADEIRFREHSLAVIHSSKATPAFNHDDATLQSGWEA
jgi:hypothetical protein